MRNHTPQLEKAHTQQGRPSAAKSINQSIKRSKRTCLKKNNKTLLKDIKHLNKWNSHDYNGMGGCTVYKCYFSKLTSSSLQVQLKSTMGCLGELEFI